MKNEEKYLDIILCAFNAALRLQSLDYPKLINKLTNVCLILCMITWVKYYLAAPFGIDTNVLYFYFMLYSIYNLRTLRFTMNQSIYSLYSYCLY